MTNPTPPHNLTEQLIRLNVAVESMVKQAEAVHKRLDKADSDREEIHKQIHAMQLSLNDLKNDLKNHLKHCADHNEADTPQPAGWQDRLLTPPVVISAILGTVLIVALILGRDDAVEPILGALPTP